VREWISVPQGYFTESRSQVRTTQPVAAQKENIPACEPALELTAENMRLQMNLFSRTFDKVFFANAWEIYSKLKKQGVNVKQPQINTWELYDKAFLWQRVRKYPFVIEQLNKLEQFEDNANLNLTNEVALTAFVNNARQVRAALKDKYGDAFKDPALVDPRKETDKTDW
jgi:hypothetical protein